MNKSIHNFVSLRQLKISNYLSKNFDEFLSNSGNSQIFLLLHLVLMLIKYN